MINPQHLLKELSRHNIKFFSGVPDSILKEFCLCLQDQIPQNNHIIAANEGGAVALAAGHFISTGQIPLIYMQNSGLGNAINPLVSLIHKNVYGIPALLFIGWRGEPGIKDEPQHQVQGKITIPFLKLLNIPIQILPQNEKTAFNTIKRSIEKANKYKMPVALIVRKGTFDPYSSRKERKEIFNMTREEALKIILPRIKDAIVISTTGKLSRELFELREGFKQGHDKDFLTIGSMGHASQIALGLAISKQEKEIYCFDGDGAAFMHLGGWAIIGEYASRNFKHILFNNGSHESVGGQPTAGFNVDFKSIAGACGYKFTASVKNEKELNTVMRSFLKKTGPALLEIKIKCGSRKDLGRPTRTPKENLVDLISFLNKK